MSLNHKRRIFRPAPLSLSLPDGLLPARLPRLTMAALAGSLLLIGGVWFAQRSATAPVRVQAGEHLAADASQVAVLDGDTLRMRNQVIRLDGIEAPGRDGSCRHASGAGLDCGTASANALASLVHRGAVNCTLRGHDRAGRPLAVCMVEGTQLNSTLVAEGWARADRGQPDLLRIEAQARAERRGLWGGLSGQTW